MSKSEPKYIGASVWADYSSGILKLFTSDSVREEFEIIDEIFLDSDTLTNLFKYIENVLQIKINIKPTDKGNGDTIK
jgi:hypothetical protein